MYAIVDIETTGGSASNGSITEVAIVLHDGEKVEGRFHTLINPVRQIPAYITALTGISNEMVANAPLFEEVAANIYHLLQEKIFVAHNVNFDYSFLKYHLSLAGFELNTKKLCTVRSARRVFPGYASYSLGNICRSLDITIDGRHRAQGDVNATVELFEKILAADKEAHIASMLKGRNSEQYLPLHLASKDIEQLPQQPGVYFFHDSKGKIIYVGKAVNLKKRVKSHFSNNDSSKRKQELMRLIHAVSHNICTSELMALVMESIHIRTLWPAFNRSQKKYHHAYGLYTYEDRKGYLRLVIEKKKPHLEAFYTFNLLHEGQVLLRKLIETFDMDEQLLYPKGIDYATIKDNATANNEKVKKAIQYLQDSLPTFVVLDSDEEAASCLLMDKGKFYGWVSINNRSEIEDLNSLREKISMQPDNDYIRGLIYQYAQQFPERKITFTNE